MADSFYKLEDEVFPGSFLSRSLDSTRATLGNMTLGSGPGLPVAASTVAKLKPGCNNRGDPADLSYLESRELQQSNGQPSHVEQPRFALSFKDELDNADDFIAAHRLSDMLVKINMDESASRNRSSMFGVPRAHMDSVQHTELGTDLSTGLLTFAQFGRTDYTDAKTSPDVEDSVQSEPVDSDHFSGSHSSFLANEKLMSVDSISSDITDDDMDLNQMPEDELDLFFNKLMPPAMQRGQVEGQEIPSTGFTGVSDFSSNPSSTEPEQYRHQFFDDYCQDNFQMPDVRLAATGMDSCPASDEDTEDELEYARRSTGTIHTRLLPSTSRQLVGESNHPSFRPGLEGGSSDDESVGRSAPSLSGIEHRRSAEGQVINPTVAGAEGGDGSSGSEERGNDGGVSTIPFPTTTVQTTYEALRGLGIVGSSAAGAEEDDDTSIGQTGNRPNEMGNRVGPVGTGEGSYSTVKRGTDRQEALSLPSLGPRRGPRRAPCGDAAAADDDDDDYNDDDETSNVTSEDDNTPLSTSLEPKYFSQSQEDPDERWNQCPDSMELEFQQGANAAHNVVYQDEEGQWVTDLAFYSSFKNEVEGKTAEEDVCFNSEDFVSAGEALEKIVQDQEEFEKEHQFMQEEQIVPACSSNSTFQCDSSWKAPGSGHILMRASQVSSQFQQGDQSYLRLSLGQFFEQRSEALGCLGSSGDVFKRPSFGYVITSPEKREPFALIHPTDLSASTDFPLNDTAEDGPADKTLNPEDLDKTLEEAGGGMDLDPKQPEDHTAPAALPEHKDPGSKPSMDSESSASPLNNSNLMLSISTIASAIADTSLSTDPSQLAAMIIELSKRRKVRSQPEPAGPAETAGPTGPAETAGPSGVAGPAGTAGPAISCTLEPLPAQHMLPEADQSTVMDTQQTSVAGELSAFDIEKYLKRTDVSCNSNCSVAHTTFNLTNLADNFNQSQPGAALELHVDNKMEQMLANTRAEEPLEREVSTHTTGSSKASKHNSKRSSSPRPGSSRNSSRVSPGAEEASSLRPPAEERPPCDNPSLSAAPITLDSLTKIPTENRITSSITSHITSSEAFPKSDESSAAKPDLMKTSSAPGNCPSDLGCLPGSSPTQRLSHTDPQHHVRPSSLPKEKPPPGNLMAAPHRSIQPLVDDLPKGPAEPRAEETHCNFRPSTSPLTHSSPSQTAPPPDDSVVSPLSSRVGVTSKPPRLDLSPQSTCSSPSLSRLTYISVNDATVVPTPEKQKNTEQSLQSNCTMALSTTIIRFSPTPPVDPDVASTLDPEGFSKSLEHVPPHHSKSLDPLPPQKCRSPDPPCAAALTCSRSQSECNYCCPGEGPSSRNHQHHSCDARQLTKADSGYCSTAHIPQTNTSAGPQTSQQWGAAGAVSSVCSGLGIPPSCSMEGLHYVPISNLNTMCPRLIDHPHPDVQALMAGHPRFNSQLAQQYLAPEGPLHPGGFHLGANPLYRMCTSDIPSSDLTERHIHATSRPLGIPAATAAAHHLPRPMETQQHVGLLGNVHSQYTAEPLVSASLEELKGQVLVPEELEFPHACCVGIASQTSLSLFNPSERWQQVSIIVKSLALNGEVVENLPYQLLMVKNKTIIAPKSTEEQKVLFLPTQAGVYQCVLGVCSWPASANAEAAARASIFAKSVTLVAFAENPSIEVEGSKSACLDFGDLPGGGVKSLPLKLFNRTHATVPVRLVISANATAWRCFSISKQPVPNTFETTQHLGHKAQLSSSTSMMSHVMQASYGENPDSLTVWVHFKALQKFTASSGELGPADEFSAQLDIEVDSPGASHVIRSVPLRARSGTARVHAPKDLQTLSLSAPLGKSSQQTLPLKNAGNIDVQLKLMSSNAECFTTIPDELSLAVGEERGIVVFFQAQGSRSHTEGLLTISVLPSGPQYEVTLRGQVVPEDCESSVTSSSAESSSSAASDVPPILSNKQFVAWGGVTLGRAVQQKLVLRNNSTNTTQQLRLVIRGQDQDCFQLQSMFSPEQRLTRHGELAIRPREDVTVHLLFAPTRVACMLAKLEIKQSGVRPSQPGVKFTIPLSGYGGTSNIILEDQRKQADGYVAVLSDIAVDHVSKVCLCVRNTGSRAAFIKAVAFSNVHTRTLLESSVISLAPSQFVLKERKQEVITVLMKSTQREQTLCGSEKPLLATILLFCGDEISRQQFRRLLQSKAGAGRKVLAENSLLKNIQFNERFLGEEMVTETDELPQRPNEAHIFYGNMSKVVVSLLGSTKSSEFEDNPSSEPLSTARLDTDTDCYLNGNVSLDVLPVKGPAMQVAEPSLTVSKPSHKPSESWTLHPDQLVLAAPTITGVVSTSQVQIQNATCRELSFDLSWPAHFLTVTPQHGVIEPQCHLQILISPNPSLATKLSLLPWSGQIYVQCEGQQKVLKVQIRQDLALDVSAAPADRSLLALAPQAATPVLPLARPSTKPMPPPLLEPRLFPCSLLEINNKNIIFPITPAGEASEAQLDVVNGDVDVRWYLSTFAPPYVKGVDSSCDVYRATYSAFRCSRASGMLGANEKLQVPLSFLPRDQGDYAQFWDLECHPVSDPQQKTRIRFQMCGTGVHSLPEGSSQEERSCLVKTEATVKTSKRSDASGGKKTSQDEAVRRGLYSPQDLYAFPPTRVGESSTLKVVIRNNSSTKHELSFVNPSEPFHLKHSKYSLRPQHYLKLPVHFKPSVPGAVSGLLLIQSQTSGSLLLQLSAEGLP